MKIIIETETPNDSGSLFRVFVEGKTVGERLTTVQTHILNGDILERFAAPTNATSSSRSRFRGRNTL
jgi:hypothetical protein